jgi:hypothetical protein
MVAAVVPAWAMVRVEGAEAEGAFWGSPPKAALIEWAPIARVLSENEYRPVLLWRTGEIATPLSRKVTPPAVDGAGDTAAVRATDWPKTAVAGTFTVVLVATAAVAVVVEWASCVISRPALVARISADTPPRFETCPNRAMCVVLPS